jgi:hypothetical protein
MAENCVKPEGTSEDVGIEDQRRHYPTGKLRLIARTTAIKERVSSRLDIIP